ncbi:MAG: hypothetical protein KH275_13970 [Clostridiales bacterium]|nr:hypothetical protein [Clostridiales bacterium]
MRMEDMEEILEKVVNSCYSVSKSLSSARTDRENCRKAQEKNIYGDSDKKI